jgi:hypothetical protein
MLRLLDVAAAVAAAGALIGTAVALRRGLPVAVYAWRYSWSFAVAGAALYTLGEVA